MALGYHSLEDFLLGERQKYSQATGELNGLIFSIARACKIIGKNISMGKLLGSMAGEGQASQQAKTIMIDTLLNSGRIDSIMFSTSSEVHSPDKHENKGKYQVLLDPLEGSEDLEVDAAAGTIFSILRSDRMDNGSRATFCASSKEQICAGYVIYGSTTMLVLSVGNGTHGFTLDPNMGEFIFTHPNLSLLSTTSNFAINSANSRFWSSAIKRYVDECIAGDSGVRERNFSMRWMDSLVCETHRILLRGGVFLNPMDGESGTASQTKLHYHANPIAMLIEQAGGSASDGSRCISAVTSKDINLQTALIFGTGEEVERIEDYHQETTEKYDAPLFGDRGLFRD